MRLLGNICGFFIINLSYCSSPRKVVYNHSNIFQGMAPNNWADEGWFKLIQDGNDYMLDKLPAAVEPLIRTINLPGTAQQASPLWQVGVTGQSQRIDDRHTFLGSGHGEGGTLVVSGLNLLNVGNSFNPPAVKEPAALWVVFQLIQYAYTAPKSRTKMEFRIEHSCASCFPNVVVQLCAPNGTATAQALNFQVYFRINPC